MGAKWLNSFSSKTQYNDFKTIGYEQFTDWPNLTLKLAERGFNEEELRKILGLNYFRVFKQIIG